MVQTRAFLPPRGRTLKRRAARRRSADRDPVRRWGADGGEWAFGPCSLCMGCFRELHWRSEEEAVHKGTGREVELVPLAQEPTAMAPHKQRPVAQRERFFRL